MGVRRFVVPVTTIADGSATVYTPLFSGRIHSIRYAKTDFDNGVGFTNTLDGTGETVWTEAAVNASATRYPRAATHGATGVAALYAGGGTAVNDRVAVSQDRIKFVIAAGGNVKTGTFHVLVED